MTGWDFETCVRFGLPFIGVVGNNSHMNQIRYGQIQKYGRERGDVGNKLGDVPYSKFAEMLGGYGEEVREASQIRPALERARDSIRGQLVEIAGMARERQKLESELDIAREIQQAMLPPGKRYDGLGLRAEVHALLQPAKAVGGDFYNHFDQGDGRLWFLIGDVSDKGIPAALFMARTMTVLEAAATLGVEPGRIAKTLAIRVNGEVILLVTRGDARLDNAKTKAAFGARPRMLGPEETLALTGHPVGGVCPFDLATPLPVYLDVSLRSFDMIFPAAGSLNSSARVSPRSAPPVIPQSTRERSGAARGSAASALSSATASSTESSVPANARWTTSSARAAARTPTPSCTCSNTIVYSPGTSPPRVRP